MPVESPREAPARHPERRFWLISRHRGRRAEELLTVAGGEALPVFSFEEEAEMFLRLGECVAGSWQVRPATSGELVSLLYGPCAGVRKVALDPPPEACGEAWLAFVSLGRTDFLRTLADKRGPA